MTAALPTALTQNEIDALHATAKDVRQLESSYRKKAYELAAAIYDFGNKHAQSEINSWLKDRGLKVTEKANAWTAAVKLALAYEDAEVGAWIADDAQVGKYAQALEYVESQKVTDVREWFKTNSIASTLRFARGAISSSGDGANGGTTGGSGGQEPSNGGESSVIGEAVKKIGITWETAARNPSVSEDGIVLFIDRHMSHSFSSRPCSTLISGKCDRRRLKKTSSQVRVCHRQSAKVLNLGLLPIAASVIPA
jgi:hypothetical protein